MLAEISNDAAAWGAATAFVSMLLVQAGKMIAEWRKGNLALLAEQARDTRDAAGEAAKQRALERIAESNERGVLAQAEVKAALLVQNGLNDQRHRELLAALSARCPLMK
jgi:DnaJ-domain-containing protein 1